MKKCIKTWHRLIKVLGNGGQTLFPVCTVLEVTIASILDSCAQASECIERQPVCAHTRTYFRMFLVQLEVPAECSVLLVMTSLLSKRLNVIRTFLDCTQRVKKGSFT